MLLFTEEHPEVTDENISGALLPQDKYEKLYEEFSAYESHEQVRLRGKLKICRFNNNYNYLGGRVNCYEIGLAVTSAET